MYSSVKRILDFTGAVFGLIVSSPVIAAIAVAIRLTMGSPILFRQRRAGFREQPFTCLKFRTMTNERDENGELLGEDERMTRLGRFLRITSLDELPQLWNILRGELSFIGPRPLYERYIPYYTEEERRRHSVRPGLTGWAQVNGRRGLKWDEKLAFDVWYVDHMSWTTDLRILVRTVIVVLGQKGNQQEGTFYALDEERRTSARL